MTKGILLNPNSRLFNAVCNTQYVVRYTHITPESPRRVRRARRSFRRYLDGETTELPGIFVDPLYHDLEHMAEWLPEGALYHDPNAYLKSLDHAPVQTQAQAGMAIA